MISEDITVLQIENAMDVYRLETYSDVKRHLSDHLNLSHLTSSQRHIVTIAIHNHFAKKYYEYLPLFIHYNHI